MPFSCKIEESESEYMRDMEGIETDRLTDREGTYKERETDRYTERVTNKNKKTSTGARTET